MKKLLLLTFVTAIVFGSFGQNKEIEINADIKSVTIYNSSAEINYQKEVLLPEGKSTLVFTNLSPFIVENTTTISASNPDVDIVTVTEKINYTKERREQNPKAAYLQDSIALIKNEMGLLKCKEDALQKEKDILFKDESIGGVSKGVAVSEIEKASVFFSKRYYELTKELFESDVKEKVLMNSLNKCTNQISELSTNTLKAISEIQVTVVSSSKKNVVFTFKFLTTKGGWAPVYDCKYFGADSPLKFIFRANVFNASGISWENVDITLSTANPTSGFNTPSVNSRNNNHNNKQNEGSVQFREIEVADAIAEYAIKHKYSIPSDSKPYLVDVESYSISATYNYLLIPNLDPFGFLMAKIPDWNKYNLIPGVTNIYNKGSFMGKTFLNTYAENDTLSLYLGKDKNIQSVRKEVSTTNQQNIIGNYYIDKTVINLSVKNNSSEKLNIQVIDQVPVFSEDDKTKFNVQNIDFANYDKKAGTVTWNFPLKQNESKAIDYKYEIKAPKNDIIDYKMMKKKFRLVSCPAF
jgi:hypothetical protein